MYPAFLNYIVVFLAVFGLLSVGPFFRRRFGVRKMPGKGPSPPLGSALPKQPGTGQVPHVVRPVGQLAALERHLNTAILDPGARERLVSDALRHTGRDRAAAIRKVLTDLETEDRRWS